MCQELSDAARANIEKLQAEIEELSGVKEEKQAAHSRLKLEINNFRQRTSSELAAARGKAAVPLVQELLPIADEFEYAKQSLKIETDGQKAVVEKFEALFDKMLESWKSLGIEKMSSVGEPFNPELHEAVSMIPSEEYKEARMQPTAMKALKKLRRGSSSTVHNAVFVLRAGNFHILLVVPTGIGVQ